MAMSSIPPDRIRDAFRVLKEIQHLLETMNSMNYIRRIREYLGLFAARDEALKTLDRLFKDQLRVVDWKDWVEDLKQHSRPPELPESRVLRLALVYNLMQALSADKFDLRYLLSNHFTGEHMEEKLHWFKEATIRPFFATLEEVGAELDSKMEAEGYVDLYMLMIDEIE